MFGYTSRFDPDVLRHLQREGQHVAFFPGSNSHALFDGYALLGRRLPGSRKLGKLGIHGGVAQW